MIGSLLTLTLCLQPGPQQILPTESKAVVVRGVDTTGRLQLEALALGGGGVRRERGEFMLLGRGRARTSGGVVVDARTEGVKLTFPNNHALLITRPGVYTCGATR